MRIVVAAVVGVVVVKCRWNRSASGSGVGRGKRGRSRRGRRNRRRKTRSRRREEESAEEERSSDCRDIHKETNDVHNFSVVAMQSHCALRAQALVAGREDFFREGSI